MGYSLYIIHLNYNCVTQRYVIRPEVRYISYYIRWNTTRVCVIIVCKLLRYVVIFYHLLILYHIIYIYIRAHIRAHIHTYNTYGIHVYTVPTFIVRLNVYSNVFKL